MPRAKSTPITLICQHCGATFLHRRGKPNRFCSLPCARASQRVPWPTRACLRCGTNFTPKDRRGLYCSRVCANSSHPQPALLDRTWDKVDKGSGEGGCWLWMGALNQDGYGQIKVDGVQIGAHRHIWHLVNGPIPAGMVVCHRCDIRNCVNPTHLFLGTPADNNADMVAKGRNAYGERNGHQTRPDRTPRGEAVNTAKLQAAQVPQIRARLDQGETPRAVAESFGISRYIVRDIASRKTWKHL
jgi:ribosomal protein S14